MTRVPTTFNVHSPGRQTRYLTLSPVTRTSAFVPETTTDHSYLISKFSDVCNPLDDANETLALITVFTASDHFEHRFTVRKTWKSVVNKMAGFRLLFLLGRPRSGAVQRRIVQEDKLHRDIVQGTFLDTYQNLTYKSLMMLHWAKRYCPEAEFVLKVDDDVLLNVWDLAVTLNRLSEDKARLRIWGTLWTASRPSRSASGRYRKWYVPRSVYPNATYPDYLNGPAYLMSGAALSLLEENSRYVPYFFIEDVYVTGLVADRAGVERIDDKGFLPDRKHDIRPCRKPRIIASHGWNPHVLRLAWKRMLRRIDWQRCMSLGLRTWQKGI
ncbi:beta-1,3-galactosyltransferase 5-like [Amblyomma americanum]